MRRTILLLGVVALALAMAATPAAAAPPSNDDFDEGAIISALPYTAATAVDMSDATFESAELVLLRPHRRA